MEHIDNKYIKEFIESLKNSIRNLRPALDLRVCGVTQEARDASQIFGHILFLVEHYVSDNFAIKTESGDFINRLVQKEREECAQIAENADLVGFPQLSIDSREQEVEIILAIVGAEIAKKIRESK